MLQSLSPSQTSHWCESLAPCGIRGELLSALQGTILEQRIDGKRFDELLKSNAVEQLGVQGLNPRLGVAIRKAWNRDFEQVRLIPHVAPQGDETLHKTVGLPSANPPPHAQRVASAERRAAALVTQEAHAAANLACRLKAARAPNFFDQGLGSHVQPQAPARTTYAAEESGTSSARPVTNAPADSGASSTLADVFAARPPAPTSYAPPAPLSKASNRGAVPNNNDTAGDLTDVFAPRSSAPNSYAIPTAHSKPARSRGPAARSCESGGSLTDVFAPRPNAPTSYAPAESSNEVGHRPRRRSKEDHWEGVSLGDALSSAPSAKQRFGASSPAHETTSSNAQPVRAAVDVFGAASLGDVLGKKTPARNGFAAAPVLHDDGHDGAALSQRDGRQRQSLQNDGWGNSSLGDVLRTPGQDDAEQRRHSPQTAPPPQPSIHTAGPKARNSAIVADPFDGVSLGDALGKPASVPAPAARDPMPVKGRGNNTDCSVGCCDKAPADIVAWLKTLPESHVPEQMREGIICVVEQQGLHGDAFTQYVQAIPPDVCAPKPAMKLKAAWKNVLAEAEAQAICRQNLDIAAASDKKAVLVC